MGKRSDFRRIARDAYPTPAAAVAPLVPHLAGVRRFVEPCAGRGDLVRHLEGAGLVCLRAADIAPPARPLPDVLPILVADAAALDARDVAGADAIITNPPWDRPLLHAMIARFAALRPTWLLFDADWVHTRQAAPFLAHLAAIVSVGRVRWFPESTMTGKDNCAWHLFDAAAAGPTIFHGRRP